MPADTHVTPPLLGLSPVAGKPIIARFDGGGLSSDGGLMALREIEERLGIARRFAACIDDPRAPDRIQHSLADMLRFRLLMIAAGYEDGNDAGSLRHDPLFKLASMLRPARRPTGAEARAFLRRLVVEIGSHWPRVEILIRVDSHYCAPEVLEFCRAARIDFVLGVASTTTLRRHVETLEASTASRHAGAPGAEKLRHYKEFHDGAASWSRVERIIARVEAGPQGTDTRFVVTNLTDGTARGIYENIYCRRGQAENHIKAWKRHLAADRTSCRRAAANQFRLMLHTGAYWLLWSLRGLMPKRSIWRVAQFDTLRLRLVKLATSVVALKTRVMLHLPSAYPDKAILRLALERLPRLAC